MASCPQAKISQARMGKNPVRPDPLGARGFATLQQASGEEGGTLFVQAQRCHRAGQAELQARGRQEPEGQH